MKLALKVTLLHQSYFFFFFLNCTNYTKSRNASHIFTLKNPFPSIVNPLCVRTLLSETMSLPSTQSSRFSCKCFSNCFLTAFLQALSIKTSSGSTRLMHTGDAFIRILFLLCSSHLTSSFSRALWRSATNIFPIDPFGGLWNMLPHSSRVHFFINSSHQAFFGNKFYSLIPDISLRSFNTFTCSVKDYCWPDSLNSIGRYC